MSGDRELDIEVLRQVFCFKGNLYDDQGKPWSGPENYRWLYYIPSGKPWRTHQIDARPVPEFSTDIGAAWLVVEAMQKPGVFQAFHDAMAEISNRGRSVNYTPEYGIFKKSASAAAELICRSALNALAATRGGESPK